MAFTKMLQIYITGIHVEDAISNLPGVKCGQKLLLVLGRKKNSFEINKKDSGLFYFNFEPFTPETTQISQISYNVQVNG